MLDFKMVEIKNGDKYICMDTAGMDPMPVKGEKLLVDDTFYVVKDTLFNFNDMCITIEVRETV